MTQHMSDAERISEFHRGLMPLPLWHRISNHRCFGNTGPSSNVTGLSLALGITPGYRLLAWNRQGSGLLVRLPAELSPGIAAVCVRRIPGGCVVFSLSRSLCVERSRMTRLSPPLPMRDGVSASRVGLPYGHWKTLGEFFAVRFPQVPAYRWVERAARGEVVDELGQPLTPESPYRGGASVYYYRERAHEARIPFEEKILFLNDELLVVDKPHFLPVTPGGRFLRETLLVRLKQSTGIETLTPIHRLDRETAGVMMLSVNPATRSLWQSLFRQRAVHKIYEAVAAESPLSFPLERQSRIVRDAQFFRMREDEGEPNAHTRIERVGRHGDHVLYRLYPLTGKMHQLRVHMNALGLPLLNDGFYPVARPAGEDDFSRPLKLLAKSLRFIDPVSGDHRCFESEQQL